MEQAINHTQNAIKNKNHISFGRLLHLTRFPFDLESFELAKSNEILEKSLEIIKRKSEDGQMIPSINFTNNHLFSAHQLNILSQLSGCLVGQNFETLEDCHNRHCFHQNYRAYDSTCNNLENPFWGASLTPFQRFLFPIYEDNLNLPVGWFDNRLYNGHPKPNARKVSSELISTNQVTPDDKHSHMLMQWGQFLDHDMDFSMPSISFNTFQKESIDCSKTCQKIHPCFSIEVPENDTRRNKINSQKTYAGHNCIELIRSSAMCGSGITSLSSGMLMHREQVNQLTSFIDASNVYGSHSNLANHLREKNPRDNGLLRSVKINGKTYLPFNVGRLPNDCHQDPRRSDFGCFLAGDIRANEQLGLLTMHTLWLREHNRIAKEIK